MTREEIIRVFDAQDAAFNRHDIEGVIAPYAPDATLNDQAAPGPVTGHDALRDYIGQYLRAFPDFRWERVGLEVDGDVGVEQWRATGTHDGELAGLAPTHRRMSVEGCSVMHFGDDGLIHQEDNYWDEAALLRQLGVMAEPAAA